MILQKSQHNSESKVIILGDPSVGKTSILTQFNIGKFQTSLESTVGASFTAKEVQTSTGPIELFMWDTAGQERYRSLIPMYTRNAVAAIIVVDVTSQMSVDSLDMWLGIVTEHCTKKCRVYIVANKIDIENGVVDIDKIEEWAKSKDFPFFRATATKFDTVEPIFKRIAEDISQSHQSVAARPASIIDGTLPQEKSSSCC